MKLGRGRVSRPPIPPSPYAVAGCGCYTGNSINRKNILEKILNFGKIMICKKL
jgi:hypothetical protein